MKKKSDSGWTKVDSNWVREIEFEGPISNSELAIKLSYMTRNNPKKVEILSHENMRKFKFMIK